MITSKEVFAKRREGSVDEAYRMALELMGNPFTDDWDKKAYCWCLIDIIKRDVGNGVNEHLSHYQRQLNSVEFDSIDEVLAKGIRNALALCQPGGRDIAQAKSLGKDGKHAEAIAAYRKAFSAGEGDRESHTGFGWELYRHSKELVAVENVNLGIVKRNLNDYLKLDIEKPSLLHSCVLQVAAKLAGQENFSLLAFSQLWNLGNLRPEDYKRFKADDGKEYPSLAEKVIQQVGKEAANSGTPNQQHLVLPYLDAAIERFPDNVWLKLDKAKVLIALELHDDAKAFGLAVAKAKPTDFWAWDLLGDIVAKTDRDSALGCYCKALSCPTAEKFTGKIRLKVAQYMLEDSEFSRAKLEIETVVRAKENEGHRVPKEAIEFIEQPWFSNTVTAASNTDFYKSKAPIAEALLFASLPWIDACTGDKYVVPGKEDKPKRRIYLKSRSIPTEVSIPEPKLGRRNLAPGEAIRVKGEFDDTQRFQIFVVEGREAQSNWDIFSDSIGVVDHVNREKGVLHFIVDREIDGVVPLSEISELIAEGDSIAVMLSKYTSKHGPAYRVHRAKASDKQASSNIRKLFCEEVRLANGLGFTENDIFIPPPLIAHHQLKDGQLISGIAILSFNKKRGNWGWKAASIEKDWQGTG